MDSKKLNVIFPDELMDKLNEAAKAACLTWSDYVRQAVIFKIKQDEAELRAYKIATADLEDRCRTTS